MSHALQELSLFHHAQSGATSSINAPLLRSPLFYVGDKYKLMPQLTRLFPRKIHTLIEPFCGGGSSFLNIKANRYRLNDIDSKLIALHSFLRAQSSDMQGFFSSLFALIESYGLSCSFRGILPPKALRERHKKTYFAEFNKQAYRALREDYNANQSDMLRLYVLLLYGFNRFLRFNSRGAFNLPVGNVDCNANAINALKSYFGFMQERNDVAFSCLDFVAFIESMSFEREDFIYLDPPYLISGSEYNKLWNEEQESRLYALLRRLDSKGVCWGLSNLLAHKGRVNTQLERFASAYKSYEIKSNYISFNDNSIKDSKELYVTNCVSNIEG